MNPRETRIQTCYMDRDIFASARTWHALASARIWHDLKLPLTSSWYFDRTRTMRGLNLTVFDTILKIRLPRVCGFCAIRRLTRNVAVLE